MPVGIEIATGLNGLYNPANSPYGTICYVNDESPSCSEQKSVFEIAPRLGLSLNVHNIFGNRDWDSPILLSFGGSTTFADSNLAAWDARMGFGFRSYLGKGYKTVTDEYGNRSEVPSSSVSPQIGFQVQMGYGGTTELGKYFMYNSLMYGAELGFYVETYPKTFPITSPGIVLSYSYSSGSENRVGLNLVCEFGTDGEN